MAGRRTSLISIFVIWAAAAVSAQSFLELPRDSQAAQVVQRVGVSDVTVRYSRPLVNGRKIWGNVVPYDAVWRAGANENTTVEFSDPVTIEGKPLAAGRYGLHMIPGQQEWAVIFSNNSTSWGSFTYDAKEDALRVAVKPQTAEFREALTYEFENVKADSADLALHWERLAVPVHALFDVNHIAPQKLARQLRGWQHWTWEGYDEAANYLATRNLDLQDALAYTKQSIDLEPRFDNYHTQYKVLEALGRKQDAAAALDKALSLADPLQFHMYARGVQQKDQQQGFALFERNIHQHPQHWITHTEKARIASAKGDFATAVREMQLSIDGAPEVQKGSLQTLLKRLEAKEDIHR
jgi:tetratricopeptide (TPR) repeat protein